MRKHDRAGGGSSGEPQIWRDAEKGEVHRSLLACVQDIEREQSDVFERFLRLSYLYNPNGRGPMYGIKTNAADAQVTENVVASNVDTVHAAIAATEILGRMLTDGADWSSQRRAKHLEFYGNGLAKKLKAPEQGRRGFKDSALKGTAVVKVWVDEWNRIACKRLMVDNVVVDDADVGEGHTPIKMHYREIISADECKARFPDVDPELIDKACGHGAAADGRYWADYRPLSRRDVVVVEGWHLPIGVKGKKGYKPGRHVVCIDGADLKDEVYEKPFFPIVWMYWSDPDSGWYGIGLAERIAGHQRAMNKLNWQEDKLIDQWAIPIRWVRLPDANIQVKQINRLGMFGAYKTERPYTEVPPAVSPDIWRRHADLRESSSHESGVSRMAAHASKPAGLESGAALREYRDQTTQRFAQQEKRYEQFQLQIISRLLDCAKDLGDAAPEVIRKGRFGAKYIKWSDVDMGEVAVQIEAASDLSKTPAGRNQLALEFAQAGIFTKDQIARLIDHPDLERELSLYTAALEHIERVLEDGLDGNVIMPDPYMNLEMAVWRGQMQLQIADDDGAPEEILEILRQFIDTAAYMISLKAAPPPAPMLGADPMAAGPADPAMAGMLPAMPMAPAAAGPELTGAGVAPADLLQ